MVSGARGRSFRSGRHVLGVLAALHAGGWPIATVATRAGELDEVANCAPRVMVRDRVVAVTASELKLAGGAVAGWLGLRLAEPGGPEDAIGRTVEVRSAVPPDRWGRAAAAAIVDVGTNQAAWLDARLVEEGRAMVAVRPGASCARALLAREAVARAAGRGLWSDPANRPVAADELDRLNRLEGRFAVVEGRISAVGERHGTVYVNFGRRWSEDFTVRIAARDRRAFARAGLQLERMAGRRVRVRGHIEQRGGPAITAALPEQIELLEANR